MAMQIVAHHACYLVLMTPRGFVISEIMFSRSDDVLCKATIQGV